MNDLYGNYFDMDEQELDSVTVSSAITSTEESGIQNVFKPEAEHLKYKMAQDERLSTVWTQLYGENCYFKHTICCSVEYFVLITFCYDTIEPYHNIRLEVYIFNN